MKEMNKNKKGFTLIELLAVIVIMGILMMTAIPAMTKYIDNSRRDTYMDTAKQAIQSARYSMTNDEYKTGSTLISLPEANACVVIPYTLIDMDKGGCADKSPWGKDICKTPTTISAWVLVKNEGSATKDVYNYYFMGTDSANNGTEAAFIKEKLLARSDITQRNGTSSSIPSSFTETTSSTTVGGITCSAGLSVVSGQM